MFEAIRMDENQESNVRDIQEKVARGEYQVDPTAVADAIVRRVRAYTKLSYPYSSSVESMNAAPGGPSTARPTHEMGDALRKALSISPRAFGEAQTQSS